MRSSLGNVSYKVEQLSLSVVMFSSMALLRDNLDLNNKRWCCVSPHIRHVRLVISEMHTGHHFNNRWVWNLWNWSSEKLQQLQKSRLEREISVNLMFDICWDSYAGHYHHRHVRWPRSAIDKHRERNVTSQQLFAMQFFIVRYRSASLNAQFEVCFKTDLKRTLRWTWRGGSIHVAVLRRPRN